MGYGEGVSDVFFVILLSLKIPGGYMRIKYDRLAGWLAGVATVLFAGKLWLVPDLSIWEILKIIVKSQFWW